MDGLCALQLDREVLWKTGIRVSLTIVALAIMFIVFYAGFKPALYLAAMYITGICVRILYCIVLVLAYHYHTGLVPAVHQLMLGHAVQIVWSRVSMMGNCG